MHGSMDMMANEPGIAGITDFTSSPEEDTAIVDP